MRKRNDGMTAGGPGGLPIAEDYTVDEAIDIADEFGFGEDTELACSTGLPSFAVEKSIGPCKGYRLTAVKYPNTVAFSIENPLGRQVRRFNVPR